MGMSPNVKKAFDAMKMLGISHEKVKPVLKRLVKLYDKNWGLIEAENYRALADAIFEQEDEASTKKAESIEQEKVLEEAEHEEPERPLKRLKLKYQDGQASPSATNSSDRTSLRRPNREDEGELPGARYLNHSEGVAVSRGLNNRSAASGSPPGPCQAYNRNKGKQPALAADTGRNQKMSGALALIKPKDEPYTDDMPQFEVPIAVIHPEPSNKEDTSRGNASRRHLETSERLAIELKGGRDADEDIPTSSSGVVKVQDRCYSNVDITSSPLGEVKVSINYDSALHRSEFHVPSLESVLKMVESRYLKSYKILDPNFSIMELMKDMCGCALELGTQHSLELQGTTDVPPENDFGSRSMIVSNGFMDNGSTLETDQNGLEKTNPRNMLAPYESTHVETGSVDSANGFSNYSLGDGEAQPDITHLVPPCVGEDISQLGHTTSMDTYDIPSETNHNHTDLEQTSAHTLVTDVTKAHESVIISLVNEFNVKLPPLFQYISHNVVFQNANVSFSLARIGDDNSCSTCSGDCLSSEPCTCAHETGGDFAYTKEGLVKEEFLKECISMNRDPKKHVFCKECPLERSKAEDIIEPCKGHLMRKFIKECWWKCGCNKQCGNRVVQRGISHKLQVFMTPEGKGWGLRTLEDLPRGTFVCEYVGEVLTNAELFDRIRRSPNGEDHSYPVVLDAAWGSGGVLKDEEAFCLDATFFGNVSRFINHRCFDSNLVEIPVEIETPDHRYYHLAFFTTRDVKAMEELTWDYGIDFDDLEHPVKAFSCHCGSNFCRNMKRSSRSRSRT